MGSKMPELQVVGRGAKKSARQVRDAETRLDSDLSRALDAIEFLAKNEIGPAPLIARISPMEAELVSANLEKAVEWLTRFADGWHVYTGNVKAEGAASGTGAQNGRLRLCAVRGCD